MDVARGVGGPLHARALFGRFETVVPFPIWPGAALRTDVMPRARNDHRQVWPKEAFQKVGQSPYSQPAIREKGPTQLPPYSS